MIAGLVARDGVGAIIDSQRALLAAGASAGLWERVRSIVLDQPAEGVAAGSLGMAERPDSRPDLPNIDAPTLVITSTGDQLVSPALSMSMADAIPGAELAVLHGAGHLSNMERSADFAGLLRTHLVRCGLL